jgi:Flp pilus assembly protein TadG
MLARAWLRDKRAVAAVEFALVSPVLFMLLAAAVDFGLFNTGRTQLNQAISAGAQYAQLKGTAATATNVQSFIVAASRLSSVTSTATAPACFCIIGDVSLRQLSAQMPCTTLCPDNVSISTYFMTIGATYTYQSLLPFWDGFAGGTATASTTVQLQ